MGSSKGLRLHNESLRFRMRQNPSSAAFFRNRQLHHIAAMLMYMSRSGSKPCKQVHKLFGPDDVAVRIRPSRAPLVFAVLQTAQQMSQSWLCFIAVIPWIYWPALVQIKHHQTSHRKSFEPALQSASSDTPGSLLKSTGRRHLSEGVILTTVVHKPSHGSVLCMRSWQYNADHVQAWGSEAGRLLLP